MQWSDNLFAMLVPFPLRQDHCTASADHKRFA
jgi:hypothetical protein